VPDVLARSIPASRPLPPPRDPASRHPRVLVFTSSLGSGHLAAARAIECALLERLPGVLVQTLDFWSLMDRRVATAIRHAYLRLVQDDAELYDSIYAIDQHVWRRVLQRDQPPPASLMRVAARLMMFINEGAQGHAFVPDGQHRPSDRLLFSHTCAALARCARGANGGHAMLALGLAKWCWTRLARRLAARVQAFGPDAVVSTMLWSTALFSKGGMRRRPVPPAVGVPTDFGVHDLWIQPGVEYYCVAHETVANVHRLPPERVAVTGIPLMPAFRCLPSGREAREALGVPLDRRVLLVCGGSLGIGVEAIVAQVLAAPLDVTILAVAGQNAAAYDALARLATQSPERLRVWGSTDRMPALFRAADLVIGKLGGLTVAEALACGRPLLATRSLGGQEGFNRHFLEHHGVGWLVQDAALPARVHALFAEPARLARLQQHAALLGRRDGADRIAALVADLAGAGRVPHLGSVPR
jgi:processive 1,2-diacylglycerol beta-glucosyltransferase